VTAFTRSLRLFKVSDFLFVYGSFHNNFGLIGVTSEYVCTETVMESHCCYKDAWKCKSQLCSQPERPAAASGSHCRPVINKRSRTREKFCHA
jgi:hypothetical protein